MPPTQTVHDVRLECKFDAHKDSINSVSFSPGGTLLATTSDDGCIMIWARKDGSLVQTIEQYFHGQVSCLVWVKLPESENLGFIAGYADGVLQVFRRTDVGEDFKTVFIISKHFSAVEGIAYYAPTHRVASVGGTQTYTWKLLKNGHLESMVQNPTEYEHKFRGVEFYDSGNSVVAFFLQTHTVVCFSFDTLSTIWEREILTRVGCAAINGDSVFISNLADGIDQYKISNMELVRSFPHATCANVPIQLAVSDGYPFFVAGGDNGFARVFDRKSGLLLFKLGHEEYDLKIVHAVSLLEMSPHVYIATATADERKGGTVKIWRYTPLSETHSSDDRNQDVAMNGGKKRGERSCGIYFLVTICTFMLCLSSCLLVSEIRLEIRELLVRSLIGDTLPVAMHGHRDESISAFWAPQTHVDLKPVVQQAARRIFPERAGYFDNDADDLEE